MISINKWFLKNAKFPLLILGGITLFIQITFTSYIIWKGVNTQTKRIENLVTIANLALEQKNRPMLESTFSLAIEELDAKMILLCKGSDTQMSLPYGVFSCANLPDASFLTKKHSISAIGRPDYVFHFYLPIADFPESYFAIVTVTVLFFIFTLFMFLKIQRRFSDDILEPLENNLLSEQPINIKQLESLRTKIKEVQLVKEKEAASAALFEHKRKVAHNIRSLVQTLRSIHDDIQQNLTTNKKIIFNDVVEGISDLLSDLSDNTKSKNKKEHIISDEAFFNHLSTVNETKSPIEVGETVKSLVKQKQYELRSVDPTLTLKCLSDYSINYVFSDVVGIELKSILSNLINNAFEVPSNSPKIIEVKATKKDNAIEITVKDNGNGIPDNIKDVIFERGYTSGKDNGSGYGLYHAKMFLESWGGEIKILETSSKGTIFAIELPVWKPNPLYVENGSTVVVLDDDNFIHETWSSKFNGWSKETGNSIELKNFHNPKELVDWISENTVDYSRMTFLIDNDLGEEYERGNRVIASLGIENLSYLVTNRYDDKELVKHCNASNIRLLPKPVIFSLHIQ